MRRTALLFGAPYGTLHHVGASLARLRATLERYGFTEITVHDEAPREQLLVALDRWIDGLAPGDIAVLVYVGHGGRTDGIGHLQPMGFPESRQFAGILALELGLRLVRLAERTTNATVILDCCRAAAMIEDPSHLEVHELQHLIAAQARRLSPRGGLESARRPYPPLESLVLLAAAAATETAMEDHTREVGLFSSRLADVLDEYHHLELPWREVFAEARLRIMAECPAQSPALCGPALRVPFTDREAAARDDDFACRRDGGALRADAGSLAGLEPGDRFRVRRLGADAAADAAIAIVTEVELQEASLRVEGGEMPEGPLRIVRAIDESPDPDGAWSLVHAAQACPGPLPADSYDIRWGRIDADGQAGARLPTEGATLGPDDDIWVAVGTRDNRWASQLYFALYHVDPRGRMRPLCPLRPQGVALPIGRHFWLASRHAGPLPAADTIMWPKGHAMLPGEHALLVVVRDGPIHVDILGSALESCERSLHALHHLRFTVGEH